ncbi:patatin-like phospholipase family protein [Aestuariirhabdus litorea]|uniref:Patatin-like phospholipase family protein n=1 Tax=Aestuariirhabdus litorea TaxID=2528527 RepID=A0A3P3VN00_9GAMM|nr:patatin-like phospholipase family protein [Aestuariirhabdus litorea]RRJ83804.1 patatin-like phospholipase family protein [Aestuariirhabdus litorea]RWW97027.1 patatin-like phospholipase family protein [Endozoicomonadaceae bacterium GTF-13]
MSSLHLYAGDGARHWIRERGLNPADIRAMIGASGGPKWLVLRAIDRYLLSQFFPHSEQPVQLLGSSIGSWRFACYASADPLAAFERFEQAYLGQRYERKPTPAEVSQVSRDILRALLGPGGAEYAIEQSRFRLNIMAVRGRGLCASERKPLLAAGVTLAALGNLASRRSLGLSFERALFSVNPTTTPFGQLQDLPHRIYPLTRDDLEPALMASASIPLVMAGVRGFAEAPAGTYRDGGVTDYHFDIPFGEGPGIVLYPHFSPRVAPGWFDKALRWRQPSRDHYRDVLLVTPSPAFIARLPGGKIPDRNDFVKLDNDTRIARWQQVLEMTRQLADELHEALEGGRLADQLRPLPFAPR